MNQRLGLYESVLRTEHYDWCWVGEFKRGGNSRVESFTVVVDRKEWGVGRSSKKQDGRGFYLGGEEERGEVPRVTSDMAVESGPVGVVKNDRRNKVKNGRT